MKYFSINKYLLVTIFVTCLMVFFYSTETASASEPATYSKVQVTNLNLNRSGKTLSSSQRIKFPHSHTGFIWNNDDNNTNKWRPQGIAGIATGEKKFIAVTWYGRTQANYQNRGVRISISDVTNIGNVKYRHVLLVDPNYETYKPSSCNADKCNTLHAGGLVYKSGEFHVPDSRNGSKIVRVFSIDEIQEVPTSDRQRFYNYRYILKEKRQYSVPIVPSFMSYDWDHDQVLVGRFYKCNGQDGHSDKTRCSLSPKNQLAWYSIGNVDNDSPFCSPFISEMQGAGSMRYGETADKTLLIASSYGRGNNSHLHTMRIGDESCYQSGMNVKNNRVITYPPGLEDIHMAKTSSNVWMLTEFGPHEGSSNNRVVFAVKRKHLQP